MHRIRRALITAVIVFGLVTAAHAQNSQWIGILGGVSIDPTTSDITLGTGFDIIWDGGSIWDGSIANTVDQRNGANSQTFRLWNLDDGANFERLNVAFSSNRPYLRMESGGSGTDRDLILYYPNFQEAILVPADSTAPVKFAEGSDASATGGIRVRIPPRPATATSGFMRDLLIDGGAAPSATSTLNYRSLSIQPIINYSAVPPGAGSYEIIFVDVTETALPDGPSFLARWQVDAADRFTVTNTALINGSSISASESFKSGLGLSIGADAAHDIDVAAGAAQSFDTTQDITFVAQAGKQLDVPWVTGATAGMLGDQDRTAAIVLTFLEDGGGAGVDTVTAGSGTPWADLNLLVTETGTVIFQGGSTNNGTFEITSATDTVLTLGNVLTNETGASGEYESRLVLPDTWYHIWLVELAGVEDICAGVSEIAVNCLAETAYDQFRLLQSILTDGTANILSF